MAQNMKHKPTCPCCGGCSLPTRLCVSVLDQCSLDYVDADVTITGPGGSQEEAAIDLDVDIRACFEDVAPGRYLVSARKDGCTTTPQEVDVACGDGADVALATNCAPPVVLAFDVSGCAGNPLPGAVCSITGAVSGSAVTDAGGHAEIPLTAVGAVSWTVSHPSGRFDDDAGSLTVFDLCNDVGISRNLSPADGYVCCGGAAELIGSPYPFKLPFILTDDYGSFAFSSCGEAVCVLRELSDVSPTGNDKVCPCASTGTDAHLPPDDIGVYETAVQWSLQMNLASHVENFVGYFFAVKSQIGPSLLYRADACEAGSPCAPADTRRQWRLARTCADIGEADPVEPHAPASYVVNSVSPLNITFTFAHGNGYGPMDASLVVEGDTYTGTAVLSESP